MNNISLAGKLAPRMMSLAIGLVNICEGAKQNVRLQVSGKDKFKINSVVQGKPVDPSEEVKKLVAAEVAKKDWYKIEGGWVVAVKEAAKEEPKAEGKKGKAGE